MQGLSSLLSDHDPLLYKEDHTYDPVKHGYPQF